MARLSQKPGHYLQRDQYATRAETRNALFERWELAPDTELLPLNQAEGRVSAGDTYSRNTLPVCRAAAGDGVAVRFADFEKGMPDFSNWKENADYAPAAMGDDFDDAFVEGEEGFTSLVAQYIDEHIENFATIVNE